MGRLANAAPKDMFGTFSMGGGRPVSTDAEAARVMQDRCYMTEPYSVGDRGMRSVDAPADAYADISLPGYMRTMERSAAALPATTGVERDAALVAYFEQRKLLTKVIHRFFGTPGLAKVGAAVASPAHQAAVAMLGERLSAPEFTARLDPATRAEMRLLTKSAADLIPCVARRAQSQPPPVG